MQNIDTDQIIPAEYLTLVPSKVSRHPYQPQHCCYPGRPLSSTQHTCRGCWSSRSDTMLLASTPASSSSSSTHGGSLSGQLSQRPQHPCTLMASVV